MYIVCNGSLCAAAMSSLSMEPLGDPLIMQVPPVGEGHPELPQSLGLWSDCSCQSFAVPRQANIAWVALPSLVDSADGTHPNPRPTHALSHSGGSSDN